MSFSGKFISTIRRFLLLVMLTLTIVVIVLVGNKIHSQTQSTQVNQLVVGVAGEPNTFNAAFNENPIVNIFGLTYEGLVQENPLTGKIEPALAQSWQISDDKLRVIFTLRSGLKWSDGEPLTADDVVFSYNDVYLNKEIPTGMRDMLQIGESGALPKVRKLDQNRVEFSLSEPFAPFLRITNIPVLPAHVLEASVRTKDKEGKPMFLTKWGTDTPPNQVIVNGAYKLERYDTSQCVVFRRNPYYWRKDAQGNPQPYIERIVWQLVPSMDTLLLQFRSGGLDAVNVEPQYFSLLKRQERQGNYKIYNGGSSAIESFIVFNLNKGKRDGKPLVDPVKSRWFNTLEFRQAIAYAIDRKTMLNNTFHGLGKLENSPIVVQSPYYLSPEEGLKVYNYNPQKAKELLLKAGFKYNEKNQLVDAFGNSVRFTLIAGSESKTLEAMGAQIKQDLSKIGISVDFALMANNTAVDKLGNTLDWEAALAGFVGSLEPNDIASVWNPESGVHMFNQKPQAGQKPIQGREVADWEAEIHRLYIQAAREPDEEKRKAIYAETQQLAQEYLPFIYLVNRLEMVAVRDRIQGIKYSALAFANTFWNIHEIKVTNPKSKIQNPKSI